MPFFFKALILVLLGTPLGLFSSAQAQAQAQRQNMPSIEVSLASRMLVVGEQSRLTLQVNDATVVDWPDTPNAAPLALTRSQKNRVIVNRQIREVFEYRVTAYQPGVFTIPPFRLNTRQGIVTSKAITLKVAPLSSLATKGITIRPDTVPYLSGIFLEKSSPYLGETQAVEAKLYVPSRPPYLLRLYDGQVIKMEKEGIAAWRFTAERRPSGVLNHDGIQFLAYTYRSSLNALKEGSRRIGPGSAQAVFQMRLTSRGSFRSVAQPFPIEFPAAEMRVRPLPAGAPAGFAGAVGNFTLETSSSTRELTLGETLTVEARVSGSGNIDQFPGPFLLDPAGAWKQFEMISKPPGSERRSSSGTVEFSQVLRPMRKSSALPPYRFIFFDPVLERYRTLESPSQPLVMTGEAATAEAPESSLAFLPPSGRGLKNLKPANERASSKWLSWTTWPLWMWQIFPAALLLFLLARGMATRIKSARLSKKPAREFQAALEEIRAKAGNQVEFYREAAKFVTTWKGAEGFEEIFETRDEICFRPDAPSAPVPEAERNRVIKRLESLSPMLLSALLFLLQFSPLGAGERDPAIERTRLLQELSETPSPEHFYNLALCEKELDRGGKAALWAYRYEAQGGDASALLQELPGLKVPPKEGLDWLSYFPRSLYGQVALAGGWALAIFLVCFFSRHSHPRLFLRGLSGSIAALALPLAGAAFLLYPDEIGFEPLSQLAVVSAEDAERASLQSQPYLGGNILREDITGSLCKIIAERADWLKIELPGGLAGWTQKTLVEPIHLDLGSLSVFDKSE